MNSLFLIQTQSTSAQHQKKNLNKKKPTKKLD